MSVHLRADEDYEQWVQPSERSGLYDRAELEDLPDFEHRDYTIVVKASVDADLHEDITAGSSKLYRLVNVIGVSAGARKKSAPDAVLKRLCVFAIWHKVESVFERLGFSPKEARENAKALLVDATSGDGFKFMKENFDKTDEGSIMLVEVKSTFFERCL